MVISIFTGTPLECRELRIVVKGSGWLAMETRGGGSIGDSGSDGDSVGGGCAGEGGVFGA